MTICTAALDFLQQLEQNPPAEYCGTIKKGEPKQEGQFPKDTDHFRLDPADGYEDAAARFAQVFGSSPKSFKAELPFDTIEQLFKSPFTLYDKSNNLLKLCDGNCVLKERSNWREFLESHDPGEVSCCMRGNMPYEKSACGAGLDAELIVRIPDLHVPGLFRLRTGAWHDVRQILTGLTNILKLVQEAGFEPSLKGVPIIVSRQEVTASRRKRVKQGKEIIVLDERVQKTEHWINIRLDGEYFSRVSFLIESGKKLKMLQAVENQKALLKEFGIDSNGVQVVAASRMLPESAPSNEVVYDEVIVDVEVEEPVPTKEPEVTSAPAPQPAKSARTTAPKKKAKAEPAPAAAPAAEIATDDAMPMEALQDPGAVAEAPDTNAEPASNTGSEQVELHAHPAMKWLYKNVKRIQEGKHVEGIVKTFMEEGKDESKVKYYRLLAKTYDEFDVNTAVCGPIKSQMKELDIPGHHAIGLPGITQESLAVHFPEPQAEPEPSKPEVVEAEVVEPQSTDDDDDEDPGIKFGL